MMSRKNEYVWDVISKFFRTLDALGLTGRYRYRATMVYDFLDKYRRRSTDDK